MALGPPPQGGEGVTSPLVAATRADDGRDVARRGHSPQLSELWVARRNAQRPTGTEVAELSGCAAGCSERARAPAGVGAGGFPVLQRRAAAGHAVSGG